MLEITPIPTPMTDKFKKIDKEYVLSDSSVNEYGFRLLTEGYQLEAFQKNPIGYYMHRREDGVVLKWDNLRVSNDRIVGTPVINLSNERGLQTCDEVENGFLNAASVGHIVVLEYSTDESMMLPGQTGPTITKWYNKECSLVDIPGNCNALTKLYDEQENELNLADFNIQPPILKTFSVGARPELCSLLNLSDNTDDKALLCAVKDLRMQADKVTELTEQNLMLQADNNKIQQQLQDLQSAHMQDEITAMLNGALEGKKITVELRNHLAEDYANNAAGLKALLAAMPAYRSIVDNLKNTGEEGSMLQWNWDDFEKNDPTGKKLAELKANYPDRYKEIFDLKFAE